MPTSLCGEPCAWCGQPCHLAETNDGLPAHDHLCAPHLTGRFIALTNEVLELRRKVFYQETNG
jgi:hypothetical protein